jgi:hypothetical protein
MNDQVQLTNGSAVQLDRANWSWLASQECDCFTATGRQITPRLVALKHIDGRVLVYATIKDGFKMSSAGGEVLVTPDAVTLAAALGRVSAQFTRGPFLLKQCLAQIDGKPALPVA